VAIEAHHSLPYNLELTLMIGSMYSLTVFLGSNPSSDGALADSRL